MIRFLRDADVYKKGMERDLGSAEAAFVTSGDAITVTRANPSTNDVPVRYDPDLGLLIPQYGNNVPLAANSAVPAVLGQYKLRKWQAALANVRAGLSNANVAFVGESTTAGNYANGALWAGDKAVSYPSLIASALAGMGINSSLSSVNGDQSTYGHSGTLPQYDPRVAAGANWTGGALDTAGGQVIYNNAGALGSVAAETWSFTPGVAFDTVEIYWYQSGSIGTMTVDCGGAVLSTLSSTGGVGGVTVPNTNATTNKTTITKALGSDTINIVRTGITPNPQVVLLGVIAYDSSKKSVNLLNLGWSGARTSSWNVTTAYGPLTLLNLYAPALTVINLVINNAINATATTLADLNAIIAKAQLTGDVVLMVGNAVDSTIASLAAQQTVYSDVLAAAAAKRVPLFDLQSRWGLYPEANALGFITPDKTHMTQAGHTDIANVLSLLMAS